MIRHSAFVDVQKHLKGGLHCHTTRSDGRGEPDDVIRLHHQNGYDFLALTDHRIYNYKNFAPDVPMTIIPGMEMDRNLPSRGSVHCHHIVTIGPEKEMGNGFDQAQRFVGGSVETGEEMQKVLDMLHENGNMTVYCHPEWSGVLLEEFENLEGNFAMEIWNSGCVIEDGLDANAMYWDDLLVKGRKIWGVATDDGHAMYQHCKGWVMVNSENNVAAILDALKEGKFYASCGPEIYDFYIEDGVAHVKCSEAVEIQFRHKNVPYRLTKAEEGQTITEGSTNVRKGSGYIRAVVTDAQGRRAWTNPIFFED